LGRIGQVPGKVGQACGADGKAAREVLSSEDDGGSERGAVDRETKRHRGGENGSGQGTGASFRSGMTAAKG
jgi:hypothetical protein